MMELPRIFCQGFLGDFQDFSGIEKQKDPLWIFTISPDSVADYLRTVIYLFRIAQDSFPKN